MVLLVVMVGQVCWIWVETSREGAAPRSNQTAYPYGASEEDAPPR